MVARAGKAVPGMPWPGARAAGLSRGIGPRMAGTWRGGGKILGL
jgi:hypothetical protein